MIKLILMQTIIPFCGWLLMGFVSELLFSKKPSEIEKFTQRRLNRGKGN